MRSLPTLLVLVLSAGTVALLSKPPEERARGPYRAPLLPRIEFLNIIGAGQRSLVTDYYWLQAIQAAGRAGQSTDRERWLDLYYYADLVTDLDPRFHKVYRFAGNAIPTNLGRETWINTVEAREILEKGVRQFPDDPELRMFLAYNLSFFHHEHQKAAEHLQHAARLPGATWLAREMATRFLAHTGQFDLAEQMTRAFAESEAEPRLRTVFENRLLEIEREKVLQEVDSAQRTFHARTGRWPHDTAELLTSGDLTQLPTDPLGGVILVGKEGRSEASTSVLRLEPKDWRKNVLEEENVAPKQDGAP